MGADKCHRKYTPFFSFLLYTLCEPNEGTVRYFYIIIVDFCTQNILKDLIQGINRQIQKYMKTTSFQKAVYLTAALGNDFYFEGFLRKVTNFSPLCARFYIVFEKTQIQKHMHIK